MSDDDPVVSWGVVGSSSIVTGLIALATSYPAECTKGNVFTGEAARCENILGMTPFVVEPVGAWAIGVCAGVLVGACVAAWQWLNQPRTPPTATP